MKTELDRLFQDTLTEFQRRVVDLFKEQMRTTLEGVFSSQGIPDIVATHFEVPSVEEETHEGTTKKRFSPPHCIAPRCTKPHRGPGKRYLCAAHEGAKDADVKTWRKALKSSMTTAKSNGDNGRGRAQESTPPGYMQGIRSRASYQRSES